MVRRHYVCRECKRFTMEKECPICKTKNLSASWKGLVIISDPNNSEIAKALGLEIAGKYALFVG